MLVWLYLYTISDAFGLLTKKPQNVLVTSSQHAQLNCSTDGGRGAVKENKIEWTYDHDHIVWPPCVSQISDSFIASSPNTASDCNVLALSSTYGGISGAYVCSDGSEKAVAMVIVLGTNLISSLTMTTSRRKIKSRSFQQS